MTMRGIRIDVRGRSVSTVNRSVGGMVSRAGRRSCLALAVASSAEKGTRVSESDWHQVDRDLSNPEFFADPSIHETFDLMRREDPVHWTANHDKHPFWSITRYEDMAEVMRSPEQFSSRGGTSLPAGGMPATDQEKAQRGFDGDIVTMDPPVHPRFRRPFNPHFSVPSAKRLQGEIDRISDALLDAIAPRGTAEIVEDVASRLPSELFFPLMGIDPADWSRLRRLTSGAQLADDESFQTEGGASETVLRSQTELFNYMKDLVRERRIRPRDDFTSTVGAMLVDGEPMVDHVAARTAMGVLVGGLETTRNALAVGLFALMRHPDQADQLRADPSLGRDATEEILRWVTPSRNRLRIVNDDMEFRGKRLRAGDWVVLWTLAANRDERAFPDPHRFDITRPRGEHLSFGAGVHVCLGRHVARLEISTLITKFVSRFADARVVGDVDWIASQGVTGLKRLDVQFTAAA